MNSSPKKRQELSPAMMRLPPSPDLKSISNPMTVPDMSLDDDTILHRGNLSKNVSSVAAINKAGYNHHNQQQDLLVQQQHRLRSVAKYNEFYPQALTCSKNVVATPYGDHTDSSQGFSEADSLGAIAGPRGVALFRLSRPHIPLLIFSHATNFLSATKNNSKGLNSISSLAFQPTISNNFSTNSNTLYLAAARGSGVLIWDASGHSPNPLLGRLQNDTTNDARIISRVGNPRELETRITSMNWMPYSSTNASSTSPLLATTTASSLSIWDLRCNQESILFKPGLRFASSRNTNISATSSSTLIAPLAQVACSSCSEECATMDVSGTVRVYDLRKTDGGDRSSVGYPLSVFTAHDAGVGIDHLSKSHNGKFESAWVTWGLETGISSAIVKVWGKSKSSAHLNDSPDPSTDADDSEDYWFMGDESQSTPTAKGDKHNEISKAPSDYHLIAKHTRSNICCARVCAAPVKNSLVVVGYLDKKSDPTSDESTEEKGGWWAELMTLAADAKHDKNELCEEHMGDFGLDRVVSFSGGAANADVDKKTLTSVLGNSHIGSLQSAELAFSSLNVPKSDTGDDGTKRKEKDDDAKVELLLCCLSDTGVLTTTAIPEALPIMQSEDAHRRDTSPRRSVQGNIIRTAFASSNINAGVFHETKEGNSLIDVASIWGISTKNKIDLGVSRVDEKNLENSTSSSPLKSILTTQDSLRNDGRRLEGSSLPFDLDIPVPVAYNSVNSRNMNGVQLGMTEMTPLSAIVDATGEGIESKLNTTSIMESIDTDRVPCPRLCGAVFGSGNGRLAIFRNGEVKKMWNWYQKSDTIRLSSIPGGQVDVASSSDMQKMIDDTKMPLDPGKRYQMTPNSGPRTLKDLVDMVSAAKEAEWGEENDASGVDEAMSSMDNFFEDYSLGSNSDDSGDEIEDDDLIEDTDELYKKYFGESSWKGFSDRKISMVQGIESTRPVAHRSIGPSSDMLQPVVTVNVVVNENQNILLAKGWKLGRWNYGNMHSTINPNSNAANDILDQHKLPKNQSITQKEKNFDFSNTIYVPDLSSDTKMNKPMDDPPSRENMEESMTYLKKLFSHQQEGDITFPTTLLSPPDSKILMNQRLATPNQVDELYRPKDPSSNRQLLDANQFQPYNSGVQSISVQRHNRKSIYHGEILEIHDLCLHNAEVSRNCNETEKESVWRLLAETTLTQINNSDNNFNGWGGNGGGALGIDMVKDFFSYYESLGDMQMLATMFCVLNSQLNESQSTNHPSLLPKGREAVHNTYIFRYAELLYSWGLFNTRAELNKHLPRKYEQNEIRFQATEEIKEDPFDVGVTIACPTYETEADSNMNYGHSSRNFAFRCAICDTAVRGLFIYCAVCKHGGHLRHMVNWFSKNSFCPTGCGCQCNFSPMISSNTEI